MQRISASWPCCETIPSDWMASRAWQIFSRSQNGLSRFSAWSWSSLGRAACYSAARPEDYRQVSTPPGEEAFDLFEVVDVVSGHHEHNALDGFFAALGMEAVMFALLGDEHFVQS